jgi:hypothetical protein
MPADLLDDILMEVTSISSELATDVESVLETHESLEVEVKQGALLQLHATVLSSVDVLHPAVVS